MLGEIEVWTMDKVMRRFFKHLMDLDPESGTSKRFGVWRHLKDSLQRQQVEDLFREYSKIGVSLNGGKTPKMDAENNGKPY